MTYYYAPYVDEYNGFATPRRSETLKNALKGLRKYIQERHCESGLIMTVSKFPKPYDRSMKNVVGTIYVKTGKKITFDFNGKKVAGYLDDYYYIPKGKRKGKFVMSDGSLRERK